MKIDKPIRCFRMKEDIFIALMDRFCMQFRDDILILSKYGVDEEKIAYVEDLCHQAKYFTADAVRKYTIVGATEAMEDANLALINEIQMIIVRVKACFGAKSAFVKNLGVSEINKFSYDTLIQASKAMIPALETALPQLANYGFTTETIVELSERIKAFEDARQTQKELKDLRINSTIERINLSNELYEKVAMYAEIAKAVFAKTNRVRYMQYLLSKGIKKSGEAEIAKDN